LRNETALRNPFRGAKIISSAESDTPLTRQELRARWPEGLTAPHDTTLWRWLNPGLDLELVECTGEGKPSSASVWVGGGGVSPRTRFDLAFALERGLM
jgi:hypothetical protein